MVKHLGVCSGRKLLSPLDLKGKEELCYWNLIRGLVEEEKHPERSHGCRGSKVATSQTVALQDDGDIKTYSKFSLSFSCLRIHWLMVTRKKRAKDLPV